jgi:FKBP-type peptidyl-prolyl cis-trans isomerase SlyD
MSEEEAEMADAEEDASAAEADAESNADATGIQDGDFVKLAYTARTVDEGTLVDTTDPEVAEEEGVDDQGQEFKPRTIVIGEGHIFDEVEDDIQGKEVGDEGSVVVPAAEAFGEYDNEQVRTVSADKIDDDDKYPGAHVQIDGEEGHIETIIGGRARVDFNHPLAGEDIEYEYEIADVVEDREAKAKAMFDLYLGQELEVWFQTDTVEEEQLVESEDDDEDEDAEPEFETVEVEKESLYVESTPQLAMNQQWMFSKQQIAQDLMEKLDVDRMVVQETIDGSGGMGMPGMMGGMGGMGGGAGGEAAVEEALEEADVDADDIVEELDDE